MSPKLNGQEAFHKVRRYHPRLDKTMQGGGITNRKRLCRKKLQAVMTSHLQSLLGSDFEDFVNERDLPHHISFLNAIDLTLWLIFTTSQAWRIRQNELKPSPI